jgi:hypothetical protein
VAALFELRERGTGIAVAKIVERMKGGRKKYLGVIIQRLQESILLLSSLK